MIAAGKWIVGGTFVALVIGAIVAYEVAVWRECMTDHSWWYCLRILSK